MRIEFTNKVYTSLFQRFALIEDQSYLAKEVLEPVLQHCQAYLDKKDWTQEDKQHFDQVCFNLSEPQPNGFSRLLDLQFDFLYWFKIQNLFHNYFNSLTTEDTPSFYVVRALKQMVAKSVHLEFFALTDSLMELTKLVWQKQPNVNWRVLTEVCNVLDEVQENLQEQKCVLRFIDNIEICLNLPLYCTSKVMGEMLDKVKSSFAKCLTLMVTPKATPIYLNLESEIKAELGVSELTSEVLEFVLCGFKLLLRDRSFGYTYCPTTFLNQVPPAQTIANLIVIIRNENQLYPLDFMLHSVQLLDGLSCIDLVKEFKDIGDKKNPYFKEACKYFNIYASILRSLVSANQPEEDQEMVDDQNKNIFKSQKFLFGFLLFLQDLVELKTRDMQNTLYVQIVEPLVHLIAVMPANQVYSVNLVCQEAALLILKIITKRSHIFDDSNLLQKIIERLKLELRILSADLSGQPNQWRSNKPHDDIEFNSCTLEKRQKFIKDSLGFLCYSIIRMDPNHLAQQQNFIAHSRKILESNLFEECLLELVFAQNQDPPLQQYQKVVEPIFMDCLQLFTYLGNDLPQKLGDLVDSGIIIYILQSLERRIPIQTNMLSVVIKFFKMLNLNSKGTKALLESKAIESFFVLSQDHRSYKMLVMPKGGNSMFDQRQLVHSFANEAQLISDRIYAQCIKNLEQLYEKSWRLFNDYLKMESQIKDLKDPTDEKQAVIRDPYTKKQLNYEQTLEASVALLSCYCMDELEYLENISTHQSCVINSIRKNNVTDLIFKLIRSPIICSAADGFIYHFQESATLVLMLQNGLQGFQAYLDQLTLFLKDAFTVLYKVLGTDDLNNLSTIETVNWADLSEPTATEEQRESLKSVKMEDLAWVAISKVHILIEMVIILGTLSKFHDRLDLLPIYTQFAENFINAQLGGYSCVSKLYSLFNRYYAKVYYESITAQQARIPQIETYSEVLKQYLWTSFRESDEPFSDLEDARNIYFRYKLQTVESLKDKRAEDLTKVQFEFVLPECKGVIQTFKCYKKIRTLQGQIQVIANKRRYHFKEPLPTITTSFMQLSANYVGDQLRLIASKCTSEQFSIEQSLTTALLIDRVLPDLSRSISNRWKNQLSGIFLFTLLNQEQVVDVIGMVLEWAVSQYVQLDKLAGDKCLYHARNLQIIIRECIQFYQALLKVHYLTNGNLQSFLAYFRQNTSFKLSEEDVKVLYPKCIAMTKQLLYKCVLLPIANILFSPSRICFNNWHYFTGQILDNTVKIYQTFCSGGFKDPFDFFADTEVLNRNSSLPIRYRHRDSSDEEMVQSVNVNQDLVNSLVSMGFTETASRAALTNYANDFEFALNDLLRGEFNNLPAEPAVAAKTVKPKEPVEVETIQTDTLVLNFESDFGQQTEFQTIEQICIVIKQSFVACITDSLSRSSINQRRQLIQKLFQFYKDNLKHDANKALIQQLLIDLSNQMVQNQSLPQWVFVCFTIQLLAYQKEQFLSQIDLFSMFSNIMLKMIDADYTWTSTKMQVGEPRTPDQDRAVEQLESTLYSLHANLSLLYFLLSDFNSMQDLHSIEKLTQYSFEDKSAFEETITYKDVDQIKKDVQNQHDYELKHPVSLIKDEQQRFKLTKLAYSTVMKLFGSLTNVDYSIEAIFKKQFQMVLSPAIKVLKQISMLQFADFDFRTVFLKDNGLKVLFEMGMVDSDWQFKKSCWETDRNIENDLKEIIENVWNTPRELQKWYEVLIQRQMFFQFRANFKRLSEEGKLQKDSCDYIISGENLTAPKQSDQVLVEDTQIGPQTKVKKVQVQQVQQRKTKSQQKQVKAEADEEPRFQNPSQKDLNRLVKKYEMLNEQNFSEFVKYYNSNVFTHVIVHFGVFLAACAKVCFIKKVPKPADEETKEQQYDVKIMLKKQILRDMLTDPNFNYVLPQKLPVKPLTKFEVPRCQADIVNQLLEMFIQQTKGYRMDILKQLKEPQLAQQSLLEIVDNKVCVKKDTNQEKRIYFLDHIHILKSLATIILKNNSVISVILKHNDSKTIKFIFRNIFYLMSLTVDSPAREIKLNVNVSFERQLAVISFFIHLLLNNYGSTALEKAVKKELNGIFIRQIAKSLAFKPNKLNDRWQVSTSLLQKFSSVWLISQFLLMKGYDAQSKDAFAAINQKKLKFQRLQRTHLVKQILIHCNQVTPQNIVFNEQHQFAMLESIQNAILGLQTQSDLFFFADCKTQNLSMCVSVITKILRLFENSQSLGKFFAQLGPKPGDSSSANGLSDANMSDSLNFDDGESSENEYGSDDEDDDDFPSNEGPVRHQILELVSDDEDEDMEEDFDDDYEEPEEGQWDYDQESIEAEHQEPTQQINTIENPQAVASKQGPPQSESSNSGDDSNEVDLNQSDDEGDEGSQDDEEGSWDQEANMNNEQISYQSGNESSFEEQVEDFGYSDMDEDSMNSADNMSNQDGDSEWEANLQMQVHQRANLLGRRQFLLSQPSSGMQRQIAIVPPEMQAAISNSQNYFNLEDSVHQGRNMQHLHNNLQRILSENADLLSSNMNEQFMQLITDKNQRDAGLCGGFIQAITTRRHQVLTLRDKVKVTEGIYLNHLTVFIGTNQNQNVQLNSISKPKSAQQISTTAGSSDIHVQNPNDFKSHMRQLPVQPSTNNRARTNDQVSNPLDIEDIDPLFMQSLSAIGLQNIADSHQIHAQLTNQRDQNGQSFEVMQDLVWFIRSQTQQRRNDMLRQVQNDICRDLPSEVFAEARELYQNNRDHFLRLLNQNQTAQQNQNRQHQQRPLPFETQQHIQIWPQNERISDQRDRVMSFSSVTMSLDLHGPADNSQNANQISFHDGKQKPQLEFIRGDQFLQNFFIILQDQNARFENDTFVVQTDRQSETILQQALIPSPSDTAQVQYQKIKGTVETAKIAFMNLDLETDKHLMQSIKILHRIPNIRICLILSVIKQGQVEMDKAKDHCAEQIANRTCKPYESKLTFAEHNKIEENMVSFVNIVIGSLKTTTQLQTTIEQTNESMANDVLEVAIPIEQEPLISKFAQLIGLTTQSKSIFECLVDLCLDFWDLCKANPWVIPQNIEGIHQEIQHSVIEQIHSLVIPIIKQFSKQEKQVNLPINKICEVFLNRELPLSKKALKHVTDTLNAFTENTSVDIIQNYLEQRVRAMLESIMETLSQKLLNPSMVQVGQSLSKQIDKVIEVFKVASGLVKLKTRSICEESLLFRVFDQAGIMVKEEEMRADKQHTKEGKNSLFVFKDEVKDLLLLLFSLCEYNLKLIFAKKSDQHKDSSVKDTSNQIQTISCLPQKQSEEQSLTFDSILESHLSPDSEDFQKFKTVLQFFVTNRKLINTFIRLNSTVVNKELIQVALMIPQVLDFDTKRVIWKIEMKRMKSENKSDTFAFKVRREHTLQDSFQIMNGLTNKQWRGPMQVEFQGEDGIDGGGLFKEWISLMSKEIFNEDMALFIKAASGSTYYPNPKSTVQPNYIEMFTFVGKVFGKALFDFQLLDCYFVKAFYKLILQIPLTYHDLEDYDSALYNSLNWMINNTGVEQVCSYFIETIEYFGEQKEIELCEGGKDKLVTDENKYDYVQLVANYRLNKAISTQIEAFLKGLYSIIPKRILKIFDNRELEMLISGLQIIDIDDLRENTLYQNYTAQSKPVVYLFEALQEFDNLERAEFIRFVTGSSKVPVEGFKGLRGSNGIQKFTVVKIPSTTQTRLPQSHTCHNQLDLPEYADKETTKKMLLYAIKEGKTFGFA